MGANNSKIVIPTEKTEKKIHPHKFWPLRYKIEDISVNITKQDSKDEGKNLLGKNNNGESTSMVVDNGDCPSKNSVEGLQEIDHVNATETILNDKNGDELKIAAGGNNHNCKCEHKKKSSGGDDDVDSPSFKIYVRQPDDKDHGDRKVDGSSQGTNSVGENSETQVSQKINPCMTNDVAGKLKDNGDSGSQDSNLNKEASVDMSNKQNEKRGRRVLLNGVWSPRDRFASLKRCVLAMSMCHSLQNSTSFGRDQRNVDKK